MFKSTKFLGVFGAAFLLPLMVTVADPQSVLSTSAVAAEEKKEPKYKDVKTRQRQSVGAKCAKGLEKVQVVLEEENWAESLRMLVDIENSAKTCKTDYEQTQIWKFKGYVYYSNKSSYKRLSLIWPIVSRNPEACFCTNNESNTRLYNIYCMV